MECLYSPLYLSITHMLLHLLMNLEALPYGLDHPAALRAWEKVHDAIASGTMPPKKKSRPDATLLGTARKALSHHLTEASKAKQAAAGRVPARRLTRSEYEYALHDIFGIETPLAKELVKKIKASKIKVQASIQGEKLRVSGKKRDDLQAVIALLKDADADMPLQYENFRD